MDFKKLASGGCTLWWQDFGKLGFGGHKATGLKRPANEFHTRGGAKILAHWLCICTDGKISSFTKALNQGLYKMVARCLHVGVHLPPTKGFEKACKSALFNKRARCSCKLISYTHRWQNFGALVVTCYQGMGLNKLGYHSVQLLTTPERATRKTEGVLPVNS